MSANNFTLKGKKKMTNTTTTVAEGSAVTLHYTGTFDDGTVFDNSKERGEPASVTVGSGQLIAGFNDALLGMTEGETKTFRLTPDQAYGEPDPDRTTELERTVFPDDFEFEAGMAIPLSGPNGQPFMSTLVEMTDTTITVDLNHPMAGKTLNFEVELLGIAETHETSDS
jgi:peptidylprolyl isomerase